MAIFFLTNLESRSDEAQGQILSNCHYTERGALTRERPFCSCLISIDSGFDITAEQIC